MHPRTFIGWFALAAMACAAPTTESPPEVTDRDPFDTSHLVPGPEEAFLDSLALNEDLGSSHNGYARDFLAGYGSLMEGPKTPRAKAERARALLERVLRDRGMEERVVRSLTDDLMLSDVYVRGSASPFGELRGELEGKSGAVATARMVRDKMAKRRALGAHLMTSSLETWVGAIEAFNQDTLEAIDYIVASDPLTSSGLAALSGTDKLAFAQIARLADSSRMLWQNTYYTYWLNHPPYEEPLPLPPWEQEAALRMDRPSGAGADLLFARPVAGARLPVIPLLLRVGIFVARRVAAPDIVGAAIGAIAAESNAQLDPTCAPNAQCVWQRMASGIVGEAVLASVTGAGNGLKAIL